MHRADIEAIGAAAGEALAAGGRLVKEMHEGIAERPFRALGPAATAVSWLPGRAVRKLNASLGFPRTPLKPSWASARRVPATRDAVVLCVKDAI